MIELLCQTHKAMLGHAMHYNALQSPAILPMATQYYISSMNVSDSATFAFCVECMQNTLLNENAYVKAASTANYAASFKWYLYIDYTLSDNCSAPCQHAQCIGGFHGRQMLMSTPTPAYHQERHHVCSM